MEFKSGSFSSQLCYLFICAVALLSTDLKQVHGQGVDIQPRNLTVLDGQNATLLCRTNSPLIYCRIAIPGEKTLPLSEQWEAKNGLAYYGAGLAKGECGVAIAQVKSYNHGKIRCYLGVQADELTGDIDLTVALPPLRPELEFSPRARNGAYEIDQQLQARCISRDGRPPATLSWWLDDEQLHEGLALPEVLETHAPNNTTLYTISQVATVRIQANLDRKHLICRAAHQTDHGNPQEAHLQLQVKYQPQQQPELKVYGLELGSTAIVNITIRANPRPRTEWSVEGLTIRQGEQKSRYEAYEPVDLGNGIFNVSLAIAGLTLEDTQKLYNLRADNEFGQQDYAVQISSSPASLTTGLDLGAIVGIVVGIAVLLIVVIIVVFARATGRWCFGGASVNTDINPDSEAQIAPQQDDYEEKEYDQEADQDHAEQTEINEKNE